MTPEFGKQNIEPFLRRIGYRYNQPFTRNNQQHSQSKPIKNSVKKSLADLFFGSDNTHNQNGWHQTSEHFGSFVLPGHRKGQIGYAFLEPDKCLLFVEIEPFLIEKDGAYYAFHEKGRKGSKCVRAGILIDSAPSGVVIAAPPAVVDIPYYHPFVRSDGSICFGGPARFQEIGVRFMHTYDSLSDNLTSRIVEMMREPELVLTSGYVGHTLNPVYLLSRFTPIATNYREAVSYAQSNNIPSGRIFHN